MGKEFNMSMHEDFILNGKYGMDNLLDMSVVRSKHQFMKVDCIGWLVILVVVVKSELQTNIAGFIIHTHEYIYYDIVQAFNP